MNIEEQNTFGEMLRLIFSNSAQDIHIQRGSPKDGHDGSPVSILQHKFASYLKPANETFFTLTDQSGLSILGYSLLTNKSGIIRAFCEYFDGTYDGTERIINFVNDTLNKELAFVSTHRVNYTIQQEAVNLVKNVYRVHQSFKQFRLNEENTKLLGKRLIISEFNSWNEKSEDRMKASVAPDDVKLFQVPSVFVPPQQQHAPPPGPPPPLPQYHAPPPPQYHAPPPLPQHQQHAPPPGPLHPPPQHPQYAPPPSTLPPHGPSYYPGRIPPPSTPPPHSNESRYGGTRKNHKRHKKQMRKNASKKIKHNK